MAETIGSSSLPPAYDADERVAARQAEALSEEKWRTLCTQHASTFVAAERRTASIESSLKELLREIVEGAKPRAKRVGAALDPDAKEPYDDDEDEEEKIQPASELLADLAEKHRLRRRTLMQHSSLLELLELPSLMDACVRSSLYEDALSIAGFANTLERRHLMEGAEKRGAVVAGVISEIRRRESDLRRMLIHRLRGDVTMPQCLEVVTALRRLNGVELERRGSGKTAPSGGNDGDYLESVHAAMEMRLQVDFLEARDVWLESGMSKVGSAQAVVAAASSNSALEKGTSAQAEQILDGIERYRTRCFEIVTQFLAIFRGSFASASTSDSNDHSHSLLSMWTSRRVQTFLTTLHNNMVIYVHDTATLRDALDASSFFASSMGRVGGDFQSLLGPIFEPRLSDMITGHWNDGLNAMTETLRACRDGGIAGPLYGTETSAGKGENNAAGNDMGEMQSSRTPAPPRKLLATPPLARFVNAYLNGLNELRRCLLPGAFPAIRMAHTKLIADVKMTLQTNERVVLTPGLRGEAAKLREAASKMKSEFDNCVEPYMNACLEVAFGSLDYAFAEAEKARVIEEAKTAALAAEKAEQLRIEKEREEKEARLAEANAKAEREAALEKEAEERAMREAEQIESSTAVPESTVDDDGDAAFSDEDN